MEVHQALEGVPNRHRRSLEHLDRRVAVRIQAPFKMQVVIGRDHSYGDVRGNARDGVMVVIRLRCRVGDDAPSQAVNVVLVVVIQAAQVRIEVMDPRLRGGVLGRLQLLTDLLGQPQEVR